MQKLAPDNLGSKSGYTVDLTKVISIIDTEIIKELDEFQKYQDITGKVISDVDNAKFILISILEPVRKVYEILKKDNLYLSFKEDVETWISKGLNSIPDFKSMQETFYALDNNEIAFFIGAFKSQNGPAPRGYFLECFLCQRDEPIHIPILYEKFPHSKNICLSTKLLTASKNIFYGNCVVFFPENIKSSITIDKQKYAIFFFNKFRTIYTQLTIPTIENIVANKEESFLKNIDEIKNLSPQDFYYARCVWGYLHDHFHHIGLRPFDKNIQLKTDRFVGLLEEIKVDFQSAIACNDGGFPFSKEVYQFIVFDRMFRYPLQHDSNSNFDSGTGFLIFEWFLKHDVIKVENDKVIFNFNMINTAMKNFIQTVEKIEESPSDEEIRANAKKLVSRFLKVEGNKFYPFETYQNILDIIGKHTTEVALHGQEY